MNIPQGPWYIDDLLTFTVTTHRFDTGALTDADSVPSYRVYEDETGTAILTGSMAKLDDTDTTGFYSEQITLSAANGFESSKSYSVYVTAVVNSVTGGQSGGFKVIASTYPANVTQVSGDATAADNLELFFDGTGYNAANSEIGTVATVTDAMEAADVAAAVWDALLASYSVSGSFGEAVALILGKVTNLPSDPADASDIAAAIAALNDLSAAEVNAEVVDALGVDTHAEITGVPGFPASITAMVRRMYAMAINGLDQTASKKQFKNAAGTVQWEKDVSDDGTTYTESAGNAP